MVLAAGTKSKIRPIPAGDSSSFIIHDNSSEMAKFIPEKYVEPLVIIARIKGFDGIDDYILHLIKERLEMFTDTRDDIDDSCQQYMHDMVIGRVVPNEWKRVHRHSTNSTTTEEAEATNDDDTTTEEDEDTKQDEEQDLK